MFNDLRDAVKAQFEALQKIGPLFVVNYDRNAIWQAYLQAFPEEDRQEHNCNCCKSFIRQVGGAVAIRPDNSLATVWDVQAPEHYAASVEAIRQYVLSQPVAGLYYHENPTAGTEKNLDKVRNVIWTHFYVSIPKDIREDANNKMLKLSATKRDNKTTLQRALNEIPLDAIEAVQELIAQGSLYRGSEYKHLIDELSRLKREQKTTPANEHENWLWRVSHSLADNVCKVRNTAIGTLLVDLSEGKELEYAVKAYEKITAPANYKRPTSLVTPRMVEEAKKNLQELGFISALDRRRLDTRDLSAANALYTHRPTVSNKDIFDSIIGDSKVEKRTLEKVEEIAIEDFLTKVLPTAKSVRAMLENQHLGNLVTLTGPIDSSAPSLMKWGNSFGWSYTGGVADSMRARVEELGGRVDGVLRFTHTWNYDREKPNQSLMDLHVFMPGYKNTAEGKEVHNKYPSCRRVGWNRRDDHQSGGVQDVDFVDAPGDKVPVENITFPDIRRMPEGTYTFKIHNWNLRPVTKSGFKAEIEFCGQIFKYQHEKPLGNKEWITLAEVELKNGQFTIKHHLAPDSGQETKWGVKTGVWHNVKAITLSPNHWTRPTGNKHWFFLLEGCVSDEKTRPFYNEFLCDQLAKDRKVTEVLAGKIEVLPAEGAELSGLGFSETLRNHLYVEIEGAFKRILKVTF